MIEIVFEGYDNTYPDEAQLLRPNQECCMNAQYVVADPYVKMYLLVGGQRVAKKKTHVKKRTLNPVFNESFVLEVPAGAEGLESVSLEFLLLDWDRVTKNEVRV